MKSKVLLMIFFISSNFVFAAANGDHSYNDKRVQMANYVDNQVYNIYTTIGMTTLIELQNDEIILKQSKGTPQVFSGASKSYDKVVLKNKIALKPLRIQNTDLIVLTNKRTYIFHLSPANKRNPTTFHFKFNSSSPSYTNSSLNSFNYNYWGRGDKALKPKKVWDDGRFTYFDFSNLKELPVVFLVDEKKEENQVNFHLSKDILIVHEVAKKFRLRKDNLVLDVFLQKGTKK